MTEKTFTLYQSLRARNKMRDMLKMGEEKFQLPEFINMLSDEIEKMRQAGHDDAAIAQLLSAETDQILTAPDIAQHYTPPEERHR